MWSINRFTALGGLAGLTLLAGCASPRADIPGQAAHVTTPLDQFSASGRETPDQVALGVHADGVSASQREALAAFAGRWREGGGGAIVVQSPSDAADPAGARAFAEAAVSTLSVLGVPYDQIRVVGYAAGPGARPVVIAGFIRTTAEVPDCRRVPWDNLTATKDNKPYARFGCSLTANLAAQIADPGELAGGAALAPADAARRSAVFDKYREGHITSSDKNDQASGAVSTAVKP
jgi:pilus assembly protein CpaD